MEWAVCPGCAKRWRIRDLRTVGFLLCGCGELVGELVVRESDGEVVCDSAISAPEEEGPSWGYRDRPGASATRGARQSVLSFKWSAPSATAWATLAGLLFFVSLGVLVPGLHGNAGEYTLTGALALGLWLVSGAAAIMASTQRAHVTIEDSILRIQYGKAPFAGPLVELPVSDIEQVRCARDWRRVGAKRYEAYRVFLECRDEERVIAKDLDNAAALVLTRQLRAALSLEDGPTPKTLAAARAKKAASAEPAKAALKKKKKTQLRVRIDDKDVTDAEAEADAAASEEATRARRS